MSVSTTAGRRAVAAERRREAMRLRCEGQTLREIGRQLGISRQSAQRHVRGALDQLAAETRDATAGLRALELSRIDTAWAAIWPDVERGDLQAIDRMLRLSERRCRLLGLDAPTRIAPTDPSGNREFAGTGGLSALLAAVLTEDNLSPDHAPEGRDNPRTSA